MKRGKERIGEEREGGSLREGGEQRRDFSAGVLFGRGERSLFALILLFKGEVIGRAGVRIL